MVLREPARRSRPLREVLRLALLSTTLVPTVLVPTVLLPTVLLPTIAGCGGLSSKVDPEDKIEVAMRIASNIKEGDRLISSVYEEITSGDRSRYMKVLPTVEKAESLFAEARDLSRESASPRIKLGEARSTLGILTMGERDHWQMQIDQAQARGESAPANVVEKRDEAQATAVRWLEGANREFDFYLRYLARQQPMSSVYLKMSANYELLRNYAAAEQMILQFLKVEPNVSPEVRKDLERRARGLRQRRLDEIPD